MRCGPGKAGRESKNKWSPANKFYINCANSQAACLTGTKKTRSLDEERGGSMHHRIVTHSVHILGPKLCNYCKFVTEGVFIKII
jgi:hypothetical protein